MLAEVVTALVPAALALMVFSHLYKYNYFFKFTEHTLVGIAVGVEMYMAYKSIIASGVQPMLKGQYIMVPALILGFMVFAIFFKRSKYLASWPLVIVVSVGLGLSASGAIYGQIITQITATFLPLTTPDLWKDVQNLIIVLGTVTTLLYFTFTIPHTGPLKRVTRLGRYFIMIALGATFGGVVTTFTTPVITPVIWMTETPGIYLSAVVVLIILVDIIRSRALRAREQE